MDTSTLTAIIILVFGGIVFGRIYLDYKKEKHKKEIDELSKLLKQKNEEIKKLKEVKGG